jgi:Kef-type K+ transport system membrane component KefB
MSTSSVAVEVADVALIFGVAAVLSVPCRWLRLPPVIAEITAGIALGPSLLGLLPGRLPARLFPADGRPVLSGIAELGILLFVFLIGWELDTAGIRARTRVVAGITLASIAVPFAGGSALGLWLYQGHSVVGGHHVPRVAFVLFIGAATAITAFPVLARLIHECGLRSSEVGVLALASAGLGDALAWLMLAVISTLAASAGPGRLIRMALAGSLYALLLYFAVRPLLRRLIARVADGTPRLVTLTATGVLLSAAAANLAGFDPIFGALAFGLVMPREASPTLEVWLRRPVEHAATLLMPVFFVVSGLTVDVGRLGVQGFTALAAVLGVACLGKFSGAVGPARLSGLSWHESWTLGLLMNTRGLTELIVLSVGVSLGVLDARMFTIMVLMALLTTAMAGPLLSRRGTVRGHDQAEVLQPLA